MMRCNRLFLTLAALLAAASTAVAQPGPRVVKMIVSPAGPSTPAMKYALLPQVRELRTGNAAVYYHRTRSPEWEHSLTRHPDYRHFQDWLELPLAQAPPGKIHGVVICHTLKELDLPARTET